jgi:hypothetical protein
VGDVRLEEENVRMIKRKVRAGKIWSERREDSGSVQIKRRARL